VRAAFCAEVKIEVILSLLAFGCTGVVDKEIKGFNGESFLVRRVNEVVAGRKVRHTNGNSAAVREDAVYLAQKGDVLDVLEYILAKHVVKGAVFKGEGQAVEVMDYINAGERC